MTRRPSPRNSRTHCFALGLLTLLANAGVAMAELNRERLLTSQWVTYDTSPWYPHHPNSEFRETEWASRNRRTTVTRTTGLRVSAVATAEVSLPVYLCAYPTRQERKTVRPYSGLEFLYDSTQVVYHSFHTLSTYDFLANTPDCLGTGATASFLGYVVSPREAGAYLARFGGSLDPIVSCARYEARVLKGSFGSPDYELDGAVCASTVFAGLTTGFWTEESPSGFMRFWSFHVTPRMDLGPVIDSGGSVAIIPANQETHSGYDLRWTSTSALLTGSSTSATANYSSYSGFRGATWAACANTNSFDPASAVSQIGTPVTSSGACVLTQLALALARLESPRKNALWASVTSQALTAGGGLSRSTTLRVSNEGTTAVGPLSLRVSRLSGTTGLLYAENDGCSGRQLAPGATCEVHLEFISGCGVSAPRTSRWTVEVSVPGSLNRAATEISGTTTVGGCF